ncbi:acyl-CoA dehydrogenase family protein [Oceanobacillus sp. CFH 90083]|uniref:acyl-CoA dehydrogenase family protein n=1 Tax=Oceanobacillus sp. CFH 90083 TaxID=2592336 RepID=UPI001D141BEE|nr:acyl-CoA dehydrogenase family protein [Oceanobacillus sp. CFH 90083]
MTNNLYQMAYKLSAVMRKSAAIVDENNKFPEESLDLLKANNFMSLIIPREFGGGGYNVKIASDIAQILASGCLSTAMIWGMHCQQIYTIMNNVESEKKRILNEISQNQLYIASVTSEHTKGGYLLSSNSPLHWYNNSEFELYRLAPTVTGGEYADAYLITAKKSQESTDKNVLLLYAVRDEISITDIGDWHSMGMRGTQSVSMLIKGKLGAKNILTEEDFSGIAQTSLIPIGHIMWASCWLGATKEVFKKAIKILKKNKNKFNTLTYSRISSIRLKIDIVNNYLERLIDEFTMCMERNDRTSLESTSFNIQINNLKIIASENLFAAANETIELLGMYHGYIKNELIPLERLFRDLRSASLMYHNDRLKEANGKLSLYNSELLPFL